MMRQYCLSREELARFLEIVVFGTANFQTEEEQIRLLIEEWESWNLELVCLATLLSQSLDKQQNQDVDVYNILKRIYTLSDEKGLFFVEEIEFFYFLKKYLIEYKVRYLMALLFQFHFLFLHRH